MAAVELIEDGGSAAVEDEFFRSAQFLAAERTTHTLLVADDATGTAVAVPLLVREIPGSDRRDAISPYSYPGARITSAGEGEPIDATAVDLAASGLVSAFVGPGTALTLTGLIVFATFLLLWATGLRIAEFGKAA